MSDPICDIRRVDEVWRPFCMFGIPTILTTFILAALPSSNDTVLLFLTTPGCVPCRQAAPLVQELAQQGFPIQIIDASAHPDVVRRLGVSQFPTFLMLSQGKVIDKVVGGGDPVILKPRILRMFEHAAEKLQKSAAAPAKPEPAKPEPQTVTITSTFAQKDAEYRLNGDVVPTHETKATVSNAFSERTPFSPISASSTTNPNPTTNTPLIESSVKLRVDDERGHNWGTGTIVDARNGEALILTCGHIFRDSEGKGQIEVHLFNKNSTVRVYGQCIFYDTEVDLALVVIVPPCPVRAIPIAPTSHQVGAGQNVMSVGCDGGANPTIRTHQILSLDRIRTADTCPTQFYYIQISGAPVGGRSGGGLFSDNGYLVGVCNSADPAANDGHFVPPHIIRHVLAKRNLAAVYESPSLVDQNPIRRTLPTEPVAATPAPAVASMQPLKSLTVPSEISQPEPLPQSPFGLAGAEPRSQAVEERSSSKEEFEQATIEEIKRRTQDGDEVILIVRSKRNPEARPEMIVLNGSSDSLVDALTRQTKPENDYDPVILSSDRSTISGAVPVSYPVQHR